MISAPEQRAARPSDHFARTVHDSVLLPEAIEGLAIRPGDTVVDATGGGGGFSAEILSRFGSSVSLAVIDADRAALNRIRERLAPLSGKKQPVLIEGNFRNIGALLGERGIHSADRIMFDLGLSSDQLELSGRGFSFRKDEPLLMTFDANPGDETLTALDIVNRWEPENIATVIRTYGEDRSAFRIAKAIAAARETQPIATSGELAAIIEEAVPRRGRIHPATKTFQAFRMAVNDELGTLTLGITAGFSLLSSKGRMAVISFHSLEDRIVKRYFRELADLSEASLTTKKPIAPSREEIIRNPRARSAKLRIIEKL